MTQRVPDTMFASRSVRAHWIRGVVGLIAFVAAFALIPVLGPAPLLLLVLAGLACADAPPAGRSGSREPRPPEPADQ